MQCMFDISHFKSISNENKCSNYVSAFRRLCMDSLDAASVERAHSFSVNDVTFNIAGSDDQWSRTFDFKIDGIWDVITDFHCEVLDPKCPGTWLPLEPEKIKLFFDDVEVIHRVAPENCFFPMCATISDIKIRLLLGFVAPPFFRIRYTAHLMEVHERQFWITNDFVFDGIRYCSGLAKIQ